MSLPPLRDATDADSERLAALVAASLAEYPGCHLAGKGGRIWVAEGSDGRIVGSIGVAPVPEQNAAELTKVYVDPEYRGAGLAQALFARALAFARDRGCAEMMLWSDTRFA